MKRESKSGEQFDGRRAPERGPEEPPPRFPYDRSVRADVLGWLAVCPNIYLDGQAYSREVYELGIDADTRQVAAFRKDGRLADGEPVVVAEEDTDAMLQAYNRARESVGVRLRVYPDEKMPNSAQASREGRYRLLKRAAGLVGDPVGTECPWPADVRRGTGRGPVRRKE